MLGVLSLSISKYYDWIKRSAEENRHNSLVPKVNWLLPWETEAIITYRLQHLDEGYRRLCFMMLDENIVAVSPTSVYRVLKIAGLLTVTWRHHKAKGSGFIQPLQPHEHWHLDISYINFKNTFVYLIALIDGYSRYIVHCEVKFSIQALDVEILLERAREKFPGIQPILITDNGAQFIAKEFKTYLQITGITHRKTRFFYPQSNGKIERFYQTCKNESLRKTGYLTIDDLKQNLMNYINAYNTKRLHSSLGYITPVDMLLGNQEKIFMVRKDKLKQAYEQRKKQQVNSIRVLNDESLA